MSDNDEKILPLLRWLLIAFFGLLLVLAFQLFLLVTRAAAATTTIRVGYPQLNGGQTPLWNIPENKIDRQYGIEINPVYIPGGVRLTQSAVSGSVDVALTGGAAVNAMLSGADLIYVGMPVPTYAFSIYARPEIKEVADLRDKVLGVITKGASSDHAAIALLRQYKMTQQDMKVLYFSRQEDALAALKQGIVSAAVRLVADLAFDPNGFDLERVEAIASIDNLASRRVLAQSGFQFEGILRGYLIIRGRRIDHAIYSRLKTD